MEVKSSDFARSGEVLSESGFEVFSHQGRMKAVRGLCQVYVCHGEKGISLAIPIVRLKQSAGIPRELLEYLQDRNLRHKGPGQFCIFQNMVWYWACARGEDDLAKTALAAQETAEKAGPKVLNVLGYMI